LSAKKRVYDIAKEIGMTGQELAAKLRDLGFTQIKSHMTALSDFELLEIQARLEAYGIVGESKAQVTTVGGLKIKRKLKLPVSGDIAEETTEEHAAHAAPPPPPPAATSAPAPELEPEPELAPEPEPEPALAPRAESVHAPEHPAPPVHEPAPAAHADEMLAERDEPAPALEPGVPDEIAEPEPEAVEPASVTPAAATPAAASAVPAAAEADSDIVRPSAKRRGGKVLGFIDPSQFQRQQPAKPESRRLRSSDDVVPEVMPTMGRDRKAAWSAATRRAAR
jgi:hypothetical protein